MFRAKLEELFGIDLRSLAALRMGTGFFLILELIHYAKNLIAFFTDEGVLPRAAFFKYYPNLWLVSIHFISGTWQVQAVLFILAGFAAIALLFGYKTRWATIISWFFLISIQSRNVLIHQGSDILIRLVLFWGLFLPWGACYSLDSFNRSSPQKLPQRVLSFGTFGYLMQIAFMYWFATLLKTGAEWRSEGTAIYYVLSLDAYKTALGQILYQFPLMMKYLTFWVFWYEALGPFLLFFPFFTGPVRTVAVFGFFFFHWAMGLTLELGLFPWIDTVAMLAFLPSWFWDNLKFSGLLQRVKKMGQRVMENCKKLRPTTSSQDAPIWELSPAANFFAAFFLIYVFFWNLDSLPYLKFKFPESLKWIAYSTWTHQRWRMFAPYPPKIDRWYIIPGKLRNGRWINVLENGKELHWDKPALASKTFKDFRWRKYFQHISSKNYAAFRPFYGDHLCRAWNARRKGDQKLQELEIIMFMEKTLPNYQISSPEKISIWKHAC